VGTEGGYRATGLQLPLSRFPADLIFFYMCFFVSQLQSGRGTSIMLIVYFINGQTRPEGVDDNRASCAKDAACDGVQCQ